MSHKVCLAGDPSVGKTSLIRRFVLDIYDDQYLTTLGTKATKKSLQVEAEGKPHRMDLIIWDVMGQPGFRQFLQDAYFYGATGIIMVCDVTRVETMRHLQQWWDAITNIAGPVPAVVFANKADLKDQARLGPAELYSFCNARGWPFIFTSAKTGDGVEEGFRLLAGQLVARYLARASA